MKIIVDMNLSPRWVDALRRESIDATHWINIGAKDTPDREIMEYARINDCIVLTHDLDFGAILAANGGRKPSVVQIRANDVSPASIGERVVAALKNSSAELEKGALLTVDISRSRLRLLPLIERDD